MSRRGSRRLAELHQRRCRLPGALPAVYGPGDPRREGGGSPPSQMAVRLVTVGQPVINNIVDITNYVLMECGQPLHAFDFQKLAGPEDHRPPGRGAGEQFQAIDHKTYTLDPEMCVIADARAAGGPGRRDGRGAIPKSRRRRRTC